MRKFVILLILLVFISASFSGDWLVYHHDIQRTGHADVYGPNGPIILWKRYIEPKGEPLIADNIIYVNTMDKVVAMYTNGTDLWSVSTGGTSIMPEVCGDQIYFYNAGNNNLYIYNRFNGSEICGVHLDSAFDNVLPTVTPVENCSKIIVESTPSISYGNISLINTSNCHIIKSLNTSDIYEGSYRMYAPAVYGEYMYTILSNDHSDVKLFKIYIDNLTPVWNFSYHVAGNINWVNGLYYSSPTYYNGNIYFVGDLGYDSSFTVFSLDNDGNLNWRDTFNMNYYENTPTLYNNKTYVAVGKLTYGQGNTNTLIMLVNATDGSVIWNLTINGSMAYAPPMTSNDSLFFAVGNTLYCSDFNGNIKWSYNTSSTIEGMSLDNNRLYVVDDDYLYTFVRDTEPPTINITCPTNKFEVNSNPQCNITASDNIQVSKVVCGNQTFNVNNKNFTTQIILNTSSLGDKSITCTAYDLANQSANSTFNYKVIDNIKPELNILCNKNKFKVGENGTCNITMSDNYKLNKLKCNDNTYNINGKSYAKIINLDTSKSGKFKLNCIVYDEQGNYNAKTVDYTVINEKHKSSYTGYYIYTPKVSYTQAVIYSVIPLAVGILLFRDNILRFLNNIIKNKKL